MSYKNFQINSLNCTNHPRRCKRLAKFGHQTQHDHNSQETNLRYYSEFVGMESISCFIFGTFRLKRFKLNSMQTQNVVKKLRLRLSSTCRLNSELYKIYYKGCALATKKTEGKIGTFWLLAKIIRIHTNRDWKIIKEKNGAKITGTGG